MIHIGTKGIQMNIMTRTIAAIGLFAASPAQPQPNDALIAALSQADVIFLGEVHDNPYHHESQAAIIAALDPSAVVFEMLSAGQAETLRGHAIGDATALDTVLGWSQSGWPAMEIYYPVFQALDDAVPYGAAQPRFVMMQAYQNGAADSLGPVGALYGLDQPLDATTRDQRIELQFLAHCSKLPREMMPNMIAVQRMRDAALADASLTALGQTGGPVVVITGNGHARNDWGAPSMVRHAASKVAVVSIGHLERGTGDPGLYDYALTTDTIVRDDPCDLIRP